MRYAYALKVPAQGWKPPVWLTVHNVVVTLVVAAVVVVVIGLVRVVGRLSKLLAKATSAAAAPASSSSGAGSGKRVLLLAVLAVGGLLAWGHYKPAATGANAAPAPSPSPVPHPTPTVTRTVAPHAAPHLPSFAFLDHLTGTDWTVIAVVALLVAFAIVRPLLKRGD